MNGAPRLEVENLAKRYKITPDRGAISVPRVLPWRWRRDEKATRELWGLKGISFQAEPGEILGVVGPNRAGKTTLMKILARITPPTSGRAIVNGRVFSMLEMRAGFQGDSTGRENVFLNAVFHDIPRETVERRMDDIVSFAELGELIDIPFKQYSSGMATRLAFAIASQLEPDILLADEVLAVGDLAFRERCLQRVEELTKEGATVLFVSHDMAAVRRLCHRVIMLNAGEIVMDGPPDEVVSAYEESAWSLLASKDAAKATSESKLGEIVDARVLAPDGRPVRATVVSDPCQVEVMLRTRSANVGVRCVLAFFADEVAAFRTAQPFETKAEAPGLHRARVTIPPHLLSDVTYRIRVGAWLRKETAEAPIALGDALTLAVYDTDERGSARGDYEKDLTGVVRPRLDWDFKPAPDAEESDDKATAVSRRVAPGRRRRGDSQVRARQGDVGS